MILFQCPVETLSLVLQAVESPGERLEVARKLRVSSVVVDVLLAQKDRAALLRKLNQLDLICCFVQSLKIWDKLILSD